MANKDAVLKTEKVLDWLLPDSAEFPGLQVVRPPTWDDTCLQSLVDRIHADGVLGDNHSLKREIQLPEDSLSDIVLKAALKDAAAEMLVLVEDAGLPDDLVAQIQDDAAEIGSVVAKLVPTADKLTLKLELMNKSACFRWHQDYYVARALVSYNCVGTEYIHDEHVNFHELNYCGNNDCVVPDRSPVCTAGVGDILLIKGKLFPGPVNGLVHRSPDVRRHPDGKIMTRLLLKVDVDSDSMP
eukprot:CAMPEP_0179045946 /NCGR_PEP_ID=MMETSP0796-20121207/18437_1 /TAXON_ID=73915 /ORGANISM="Pyrodinium bahamense, Strain pbaha01" /LENGTH=240 /DNA_ID=CAMNT_0020742363 /DNA_START=62 /DNA_END=784 /DNA_ORIENTATION=-